MPADLAPQSDRRVPGWIGTGSILAVVAGWLALVLHYQYQVAWLGEHVLACDALLVAGSAGIVLTRSVERWGGARVRPVVLRLVFSFAVLAGTLVAAEFAARFVFRRALARPEPHISFNSLGFREREIEPKNATRYRIAVIGDSFTFGQGIEERDRFSNMIQGVLGPHYEVLNFGLPGDDMAEHLGKLDTVLKLSPDFVLLQLYKNDFETRTMIRPRAYPLLPADQDSRMARSSLIYRLLLARWVQFQELVGLIDSYAEYMARHLSDPDSPDAREAFGMLRRFIDRARAAGVPVGAVLFPDPEGINPDGYPFAYLHDRVRTICAEGQVPYLDLLPAFSTFPDPRSMRVGPFDAHPNARANQRAAAEILLAFGPFWRH